MLVTEQYVQLATSRLLVKTLGQSTNKLLVVHGGPDWDHSYLVPAFQPLADEFEIILFDIRGCGKSQKFANSDEYSVDLVVNDIKHLMDAFHLTTCNLLGFSFGGNVAL